MDVIRTGENEWRLFGFRCPKCGDLLDVPLPQGLAEPCRCGMRFNALNEHALASLRALDLPITPVEEK